MRRTDRDRELVSGWCFAITPVLVAVGLSATPSSVRAADRSAEDICLDSVVRHTAAELVGEWSQNYAFAKVVIGEDGRRGEVTKPRVYMQDHNSITCLASYRLVKPNGRGGAYNVSIDHLQLSAVGMSRGWPGDLI